MRGSDPRSLRQFRKPHPKRRAGRVIVSRDEARAAVSTRPVVGDVSRVSGGVPCGMCCAALVALRQAATRRGSMHRVAVMAVVQRQSTLMRRVPRYGIFVARQPTCTVHTSCGRLFLQRTRTGRERSQDERQGRVEGVGRHGRVVVGWPRRYGWECRSCRCKSREG